MRLPKSFMPEKENGKKIEDLLQEPDQEKLQEKGLSDELESLIDEASMMMARSKNPSSIERVDLAMKVERMLKGRGYFSPSSLLIGTRRVNYLVRAEDTEAAGKPPYEVIFPKPYHNRFDYAFAKVRQEDLKEFCDRIEKHYREERNKKTVKQYGPVRAIGYGIGMSISTVVMATFGLIKLAQHGAPYDSAMLVSQIALSGTLAIGGFYAGKKIDAYLHSRNRRKALGLCQEHIESSPDALRRALS